MWESISLVELVAEGGEGRHDGVGVGVFGIEVGGDFGVLLVAEPGVVVGEGDAVEAGFRCGPCGRWGAGVDGFWLISFPV